jgi:hypothetical protein
MSILSLKHCLLFVFMLLLLLLAAGCGSQTEGGEEVQATQPPAQTRPPWEVTPSSTATPDLPLVDLALSEESISFDPLPLRASFPFTITALIANDSQVPAVDVPVMLHITAKQEELGFTSFFQVLTVTVPASHSLPITLPVRWNLSGGEHQILVQVNRLPQAWQQRIPLQAETEIKNNVVLLEEMVDPFDAYASDLCPGRVDIAIEPTDIVPEPDHQRVMVRVHNLGNRAAYNLPVVVTGEQITGIVYTPAIPPCGGTAQVYVPLDRPLQQGESLTVLLNPGEWPGSLAEDDLTNNSVSVSAGLLPGLVLPAGSQPVDYDFQISTTDIEIPEMWIVLVTVHNLGTRDADMVPIRVENEGGRKILDAIPLVPGESSGVAAIRVGYLWIRGGILTFTVNPQDAKGAYPEANREDNVATFTLP